MSYTIIDSTHGGKAIRCNHCGSVSHSSRDVQQKYCGRCKRYHNDMVQRPTQHHATGVDDGYWMRRQQEEAQQRSLFDSYSDARPSSTEECRAPEPARDTSIDFGNSSSSWDSSSSSSDSSSSSSSDSGSYSCD